MNIIDIEDRIKEIEEIEKKLFEHTLKKLDKLSSYDKAKVGGSGIFYSKKMPSIYVLQKINMNINKLKENE